jgi:quinolinate synthase
MNESVIQFEQFHQLQEDLCQQKIIDAKKKLEDDLSHPRSSLSK